MDEQDWLAKRFEEYRSHLRAVAYRMLGSLSEADDAVQEAWLRLSRSETSGIENLGGWLTTVVGRVCLDMLRSRISRRVMPLGEPLGTRVPEPLVSRAEGIDPEHEALLADSVGLALLVVLETLSPAERLALVLHADREAVPSRAPTVIRGAHAVARGALASSARARFTQPALVNGAVGLVMAPRGQLFLILGFTITDGKITEIDVVADPARLRQLDLAVLDG